QPRRRGGRVDRLGPDAGGPLDERTPLLIEIHHRVAPLLALARADRRLRELEEVLADFLAHGREAGLRPLNELLPRLARDGRAVGRGSLQGAHGGRPPTPSRPRWDRSDLPRAWPRTAPG